LAAQPPLIPEPTTIASKLKFDIIENLLVFLFTIFF
jgi:hypothetical protein